MKKRYLPLLMLFLASLLRAQETPQVQNNLLYKLKSDVQADRIERDIEKLVSFGTRHTMSDTVSKKRGIGAARRWIKSEFENISKACGGCLEVYEQRTLVKGDPKTRIPKTPTW